MHSLKPNPKLIPRACIDYNAQDLISAMCHLKTRVDITAIKRIFPNTYLNFTNSGRTSLYIILKALKLPNKSKIGVPLYTCPSVFDAVIKAGHKPVFLDCENYTLSPTDLSKKIDELAAVVVGHIFGQPAELDKIQEIVDEKPIIEDCAHALFSRYKGRLVGTIATAGFFSFRAGKYLSAGEGGMITTKDPHLAHNIEQEIGKLPKPSATNEIKHIFATYTRSVLYHRPWFGLLSLPVGSKIEDRVDLMNKYGFNITKIRNTNLYTITSKIRTFDKIVEQQRKNSYYMIQKLSGLPLKLPIETADTYFNYFMFPILFNNEKQRDYVSERLRIKGIDSAKLFNKTPEKAKQYYGYRGDCPITEQIVDKILVVPNYHTLKIDELKKICETIESCFSIAR